MRDPQVPGWADYPNLGVDDRALYLTYNVKNVKARLLVFEKTDLYDDGSARAIDLGTLQNPGGGNALSVQPCHHFGPVTSAHLVNTLNPGTQLANAIVVRSVRWQAGTPSVGTPRNVTVHDYAAPPRLAEQLGEPKALYVGGTRTRGAVARADAVWLAFAATRGAGDRWTAARWCRIDAVGGREARAQDQLVEDGAHHVFPNLVVDDAGNLLMIASRTASDEHPSLHYGRWPPSGPAEAGELVRGQGPHRRCRGGQSCDDKDSVNGWGDYNGIALDPDGATVWAIGGVGHTTDRQLWATAIVTL